MTSLSRRALGGLARFLVVLALLLFAPAWSLRYWEAWLYWSVFSFCTLAITVYFLERDPGLIERRLHSGPAAEREKTQKIIQTIAIVLMGAVFVVPGLDRRFGWGPPIAVVWEIAADALVATGFLVMFLAFRENTHAAAIIVVEAGQRVATSGVYRVVRHPMYAGALLAFLATPVALGSLCALLPALALSVVIAVRLLDEERYLVTHLPGYADYRRTVRSRLFPGIW